MRIVYFTICSANYLAYARTLYASLRQAGVTAPFQLFLVDEVAGRFDITAAEFPCIETRELGIPNHFDMAARYTVMEMNTAVKPFCVEWLFDNADAKAAVYLDPDIYVIRPLVHVEQSLEGGANAVLTPHSTAPLDDGGDPDDIRLLRTGVYNLGFGAFRRSPETRALLRWWGQQLESRCVVDLEAGLFVDQKFMDLTPSYLDDTAILRHPGYNTAYWNLPHRPVTIRDGEWYAGEDHLHFFHFSGVVPGDHSVFSKHQNRFGRDDIGDLAGLLDEYLDGLARHALLGNVRTRTVPYFYGNLSNGLLFTEEMRLVYAAMQKPGPHPYEVCFSPDLNLYRTLAPEVEQQPGAPVTRLLHTIWRRRADVRRSYALETPVGREGLANWFLSSGAREHQVPAPILASYRRTMTSPPAYFTRRPAGLGIYGYFLTESGVGTGARANWRAAQAAGIPSEAFLMTTGAFQDSTDTGIPLSSGASRYDCLLLHMNADQTMLIDSLIEPERLAGRYRLGYWAWELSRMPEEWRAAYQKVDEVWAPSTFASRAFAQATRKPVKVVPHAVPIPAAFEEDEAAIRERFGIPADHFAFLTAFDFNSFLSRKNPIAVIRAFQAAFPLHGPSSPVLVIKCHGRPGRDQGFRELMAIMAEDARIVLIDRVLDPSDIARLQSCCDAFVSLHRSEGFGLWIAECMAFGKPVVTTNYGGSTDFALPGNSLPIGFSMIPVGSGNYPFGAGQWWAEPSHDQAVAAMIDLAEDASLRLRIGSAARAFVAETLSFQAVGQLIAERLGEIRGEVAEAAA